MLNIPALNLVWKKSWAIQRVSLTAVNFVFRCACGKPYVIDDCSKKDPFKPRSYSTDLLWIGEKEIVRDVDCNIVSFILRIVFTR